MLIQSEKFIQTHGSKRLSAAVYGQDLNHTTWRLCKMNLAIRGIEADIQQGDALRDTLLPKLIYGELRVPQAEQLVGRAT